MKNSAKNPLGRATEYPQQYSPESLFAIPRSDARQSMRIADPLPFHGEDLWNAWEFAWLEKNGRPAVSIVEMRIPADSPNLIESKSLKLYLNSFAMTRFGSVGELQTLLSRDLGHCAGAGVAVSLRGLIDVAGDGIGSLPGTCIDDAGSDFEVSAVDATRLECAIANTVDETLHSNLLRSNCPVTGQPDSGSLLIRYEGPKIDRDGLAEYLASFRYVAEFHEACVERIFVDLKSRCSPSRLTVYARYNRRGGIDINPFRSDFELRAENLRLPRQ